MSATKRRRSTAADALGVPEYISVLKGWRQGAGGSFEQVVGPMAKEIIASMCCLFMWHLSGRPAWLEL